MWRFIIIFIFLISCNYSNKKEYQIPENFIKLNNKEYHHASEISYHAESIFLDKRLTELINKEGNLVLKKATKVVFLTFSHITNEDYYTGRYIPMTNTIEFFVPSNFYFSYFTKTNKLKALALHEFAHHLMMEDLGNYFPSKKNRYDYFDQYEFMRQHDGDLSIVSFWLQAGEFMADLYSARRNSIKDVDSYLDDILNSKENPLADHVNGNCYLTKIRKDVLMTHPCVPDRRLFIRANIDNNLKINKNNFLELYFNFLMLKYKLGKEVDTCY